MRVIALASQKGGSGKTTLAGHLAVQAQQAGAGPVVLLDMDPQGTLTDWWDAREAADLSLATPSVARLGSDLEHLRKQGFRLAIIDTPPANLMVAQAVIQHAELAVVPVRPGPHDLRATGVTIEMCERAGKPIAFVLNGVLPGAHLVEPVEAALLPHGSVMTDHISHSLGLSESMADGLTVMEADPESATAAALSALWDQLCQRADRNFRRTVFSLPGTPAMATFSRQHVGGFGRRVTG